MIKLVNVSKAYENKKVLENINYTFEDTGLYIISGNNGCGKTTLLNIISNKISYQGNVYIDNDVFFLSYNDYLIDQFSLKENIELHSEIYNNFNRDIFNLIDKRLLNKKVSKLSLGERQRAGILIALFSNSKIVLLDEPLVGLDKKNKHKIIRLLKKESKRKLIIVVTHEAISYKNATYIDMNKRMSSDNEEIAIKNVINKKVLKRKLYWAILLHRKSLISKLILLFSLISIMYTHIFISNELNIVRNEFNKTFEDKAIYYKENDMVLNDENFYDHVVSNLSKEIFMYGNSMYTAEMYDAIVGVGEYFVDNGFLFSKVNYIEGLKEDEIILEINIRDFCISNNYNSCIKESILDDLKGRILRYSYNNSLFFKIKGAIEGENNKIYSSNVDSIASKIKSIHKEVICSDYMIAIYNSKLENFYDKITSISSLLNYKFANYYNDSYYTYFLVSESDKKAFSQEEIVDKSLVVCSDIGVTCNAINFGLFKSLIYIDKENVEDKIYYKRYDKQLNYNEIVVSSALLNLLSKNINDRIDLKFYIDEELYALDEVVIVDVINNDEYLIYHDKYDYLLFKNRFNKYIYVDYVYSDNLLEGYTKDKLFYYTTIIEAKNYIEGLFNLIIIFLYLIWIVVIILLLFIEFCKEKKHKQFFNVLKYNNVANIHSIYRSIYLVFGLIFIFEINLFISYNLAFIIVNFIKKKK